MGASRPPAASGSWATSSSAATTASTTSATRGSASPSPPKSCRCPTAAPSANTTTIKGTTLLRYWCPHFVEIISCRITVVKKPQNWNKFFFFQKKKKKKKKKKKS